MAARSAAASGGSRPSAAAGGGAIAPALNRRSAAADTSAITSTLDVQDSRSLLNFGAVQRDITRVLTSPTRAVGESKQFA